jgi:hypothetical protein
MVWWGVPRHLSFLAAALSLALSPAVSATVLVPTELTGLARDAAAIVRGRVVTAQPSWADGRRRVETIVTLAVEESFKGGQAGQISFEVPGGVMGRYRSVLVGAPTFHEGEEVVVFLGAKPPALAYLVGLGQGVFRIVRDDGVATVVPIPLTAQPFDAGPVIKGDPSRRPLRLEAFSSALRAILAGAPLATQTPGRASPPGVSARHR